MRIQRLLEKMATDSKMEKEIVDKIDNDSIGFLNSFLKKGETVNGEKYKSLDSIITKYKQTIGSSKKEDVNLQMLAPIIAAMITTIEKK
jgi:hypothetical protein